MKSWSLFLLLLLGSDTLISQASFTLESTEKSYTKEYDTNGNLKAEGWELYQTKEGYWKTYHSNGVLATEGHYKYNEKNGYWFFYDRYKNVLKEGHYNLGNAQKWWIFYDIANQKMQKTQYRNNQKNGFALCYTNNKLKKAEKYIDDQKVDEWTSMIAFKLDNPSISFK